MLGTYTWDKVDLKQGFIVSSQRKTEAHNRTPLHIPIHPSLQGELEAVPVEKRKGYVIPELAAQYLKRNSTVTAQFQALFKEHGLEVYAQGAGGKSEKRTVIQYGFHSLRHTFVSIMAEYGVPQAVVQAIVGHSTIAMTLRYTHIGDKAVVQAMQAMPALDGVRDQAREMRREIGTLSVNADIAKLKMLLDILKPSVASA